MMTSREELEKLTVLQLKEKLKSRKLLLSGTKPELVSRLYESMVAEEKLLGTIGLDSEPGGPPSDFDLETLDVDEVLGPDNESDHPVVVETKEANITKMVESMVKPAAAEKVATTKPTKPVITAPESDKTATKPTLSTKQSSAEVVTALSTTDGKEASGKLDLKDGQKMLNTSLRLGLPCKTTTTAPDTATAESPLEKRAKRFGTAISGSPSNDGDLEAKKRARLERFGLTVAPSVDEKKVKRQERFGVVVDDATKKKMERAERFSATAKKDEPKAAVPMTPEERARFEKRAQRFGVA